MFFRLFIFLFSFFSFVNVFSFETQGFEEFSENSGKIEFVCNSQCFIFLGPKNDNNNIEVVGNIAGNGIIGYGFLNGQKIIPGENLKLDTSSVNKKFYFNNLNYFSQLTKEINAVLFFDGKTSSKDISINLGQNTLSDSAGLFWDNFWKIETLTPYSINLRYGVSLLGTSIVKYGYFIFIIFFILSLFIKKYKNIDSYLVIGFSLFLFIAYRNLITYTNITNTGLSTYTNASYEDKRFFDLGDYLVFIDKVLSKIDKSQCNIYVESQDWPFKNHMQAVYLKPCKIISDKLNSDYALYYKKDYDKELDGKILVDYNNSYLIKLNK